MDTDMQDTLRRARAYVERSPIEAKPGDKRELLCRIDHALNRPHSFRERMAKKEKRKSGD